jgi:hypothetical protein
MKKSILFALLTGFVFSYTVAQDSTSVEIPESYPVTTFESNFLVDDQTTVVFDKKTLDFAIQHKFAPVGNGISDLWGIYSPATNIRLALNYVPVKNLQIGAGISKENMITDLSAKYSILQQSSDNKMPVSLAVYGVIGMDGRGAGSFDNDSVTNTKGQSDQTLDKIGFVDKMSYFTQVMVSRKFTEWFSVQGGASFTHYNMVAWDENHDLFGLHALGRIKISPQSSLTFNYNQPLKIESISEQNEMPDYTPTIALGWQISTFTHAFQIYVSNAPSMLPMENMMDNRAKFNKDGIAIGFTITRLWAF